jgi:hypothetical protein
MTSPFTGGNFEKSKFAQEMHRNFDRVGWPQDLPVAN